MITWLSKIIKSRSEEPAKPQPGRVDTLFRVTRRLAARVTQVEAQAGNNRRDIARLEKKLNELLRPAQAPDDGRKPQEEDGVLGGPLAYPWR
jgi:hypothetical protein